MTPASAVRDARRHFAGTATWRRSVELRRAFQVEQTDPAHFYGTLARDAVRQLDAFMGTGGLNRRTVLDIGGGPGYFRGPFTDAGATYIAVDVDSTELSAAGLLHPRTILGSGTRLPMRASSVDVCFSSNVLEHVDAPERMADEMVRVTAPGGLVYLSYTLWLSPHGGHETAPWHYLGGHRAARRYERRHGRPPKNVFGTSLYALSAGRMLRWVRAAERADHVEVLALFPRYLPTWAYWLTLVPGVRELALWNLVLVLRRR
ncbi:class I SAM-dependent methyltransferase [Streptomyces chartreusis]|uniref:class I SAM-dependent methyltransferase n=1 Tax=Streptomyces chartreusis TaxID=1969 RepID=UPI00368ECA99